MDPLGLALENFDAVGRWRTRRRVGCARSMPRGRCPTGRNSTGRRLDARRCSAIGPVRDDRDREAADLCARPRARVPTTRRPCARSSATGRAQRLSVRRRSDRWASSAAAPPFQMRRSSRVMIVTKRALPRRTFLRGLGAALALPLLDAMVPALSAQARHAGQAAPPPRVHLHAERRRDELHAGIDYWKPAGEGTRLRAVADPEPLAPFRDQMVVVSGLITSRPKRGNDGASGDHTRGTSSWLTGVHPKRTEGADVRNGISADQIAARGARQGHAAAVARARPSTSTSWPGNCENGYSCVYMNTLAWTLADDAAADREQSARGVRAPVRRRRHAGAARSHRRAQNRSILDSVTRRSRTGCSDGSGPATARR